MTNPDFLVPHTPHIFSPNFGSLCMRLPFSLVHTCRYFSTAGGVSACFFSFFFLPPFPPITSPTSSFLAPRATGPSASPDSQARADELNLPPPFS